MMHFSEFINSAVGVNYRVSLRDARKLKREVKGEVGLRVK